MSIADQVYAQARYMAGEETAENDGLLRVICQSVVSALTARLRDDLTPEDCLADFVTAAGMYAVAMLSETEDLHGVEQMAAGDFTVRRGSVNTAAERLRKQADLVMTPYLKGKVAFLGV